MSGADRVIDVAGIAVGNEQPMALFGGMNVLESRDMALRVAEAYVEATSELGIPYVFKASFDKANRTSLSGKRGLGAAGRRARAIPSLRQMRRCDLSAGTELVVKRHGVPRGLLDAAIGARGRTNEYDPLDNMELDY